MNKHYGIVFNRKSGKVITMLSDDYGCGLLKMYAMGNLTASRDYIVFNAEGTVVGYFEGKKNDMPKICRDMEGKHIEEFGFSMSDIE